MEIIIHGTGTMGTIVSQTAHEKNITVSGFADELTNEIGDVIIDFSHFSRLDSLLDFAEVKNIPLVIATTGYDKIIEEKIRQTAEKIPVLLSSNMSLGINLMQEIL